MKKQVRAVAFARIAAAGRRGNRPERPAVGTGPASTTGRSHPPPPPPPPPGAVAPAPPADSMPPTTQAPDPGMPPQATSAPPPPRLRTRRCHRPLRAPRAARPVTTMSTPQEPSLREQRPRASEAGGTRAGFRHARRWQGLDQRGSRPPPIPCWPMISSTPDSNRDGKISKAEYQRWVSKSGASGQ